jgi:hypothetical protein
MFGNPVEGPRVVPFGTARTAKDVLPNGRPSFRVTQRFNDYDAIVQNGSGRHGALDLGNYHCGDKVIAMLAGTAKTLSDPNGAIGVELTHSNGYKSQYWHLQSRAVHAGATVNKGQLIGYVGQTGLTIGGCHLHLVTINSRGTVVDPWPLLDQNAPAPTLSVAFNQGVNGVNLRTAANPNAANVYATAYLDPKGIIRLSDGRKIGATSSSRRLYRTVTGTDGLKWNELQIYGTGVRQYVQARFMHPV